ncbi:MAG: phosphohydrolase, partial [Clostridiales bacterium]|nr:phosphohydrolase [Clostridiales bacterium]
MKCFYNNDADGRCAGFWVALSAGLKDINGSFKTEFIETNYGKPFPLDEIKPDEQVYIVDYSIKPAEMLRLLEITKDVTWIDHHKTAIEKYVDFPQEIRGVRYDG